MSKCPGCGHENVPGTQFCEGCGEELPAANPSADNPAAPSAGATIQCPACDNMNPADNVACEVCGAELRPSGASAPDATATGATAPVAIPSSANGSAPPAPTADAPVFEFDPPDTPANATPAAVTPPTATPDPASTIIPPSPLPDVDVSMPAPPLSTPVPGAPPVPLHDLSTPPAATSAPAGDLAPGKLKLVVEQGQTVGAQFVLGDPEMLVGREDAEDDIYPDIDLSDQDAGYVHRRHATLKFENGSLTVTHLGGGNKTRINNRPIPDNEPQPVKLGDKIAFGKVVLRVVTA